MAVRRLAALFLVALAVGSSPAAAQPARAPTTSHVDPASLAIDEARFLGTPLDPELALIGDDGARFRLGDLFGRPLLLLFSYYSCDGACPTVNRALAEAIAGVTRFRAGTDYRVLTLSFDAKDTPATVRRFVRELGAGAAPDAWRFALAADPRDVKRIAEQVGYKYFWSVQDRLFVHPNVMIVVSSDGRVARYLPSWNLGARDVELALTEGAGSRAGSTASIIDIARGICFSYSYREGRYVLNAPLFVAAGSLTLGFAGVIAGFAVFRRSRRREVPGV
ncbi:MAG: SCO family protein [Burkholderiales bacterium]